MHGVRHIHAEHFALLTLTRWGAPPRVTPPSTHTSITRRWTVKHHKQRNSH